MEREERNKAIVEYIDLLINKLGTQYWDIDFSTMRSKAIGIFCNMEGTIEELQPQIESSFINMISDLDAGLQNPKEKFQMTPEEKVVYQDIKNENMTKRAAMGLGNAKSLTLKNENNTRNGNGGYISFLAIMGVVIALVVIITVVVCNILL